MATNVIVWIEDHRGTMKCRCTTDQARLVIETIGHVGQEGEAEPQVSMDLAAAIAAPKTLAQIRSLLSAKATTIPSSDGSPLTPTEQAILDLVVGQPA